MRATAKEEVRRREAANDVDPLWHPIGGATLQIAVDPDLAIPTALIHVHDEQTFPLVRYRVRAGARRADVVLTTFVEGYSAKSITTLHIPPGAEAQIAHTPIFKPEKIREVRELTRASLHARATSAGAEHAATFRIKLLARDTADLLRRDNESVRFDRELLAAFVTPRDPSVLALLRRAADLHPQRKLNGYFGGERGVERQVKAMYEAVKRDAEIALIHSIACCGADPTAQRVRLPRSSIAERAANCADAAVLFASLLEAATIEAGIVFVPQHVLAAYRPTQETSAWRFVELTMNRDATFEDARARGERVAAHWAAQDKIEVVDIVKARQRGITPGE